MLINKCKHKWEAVSIVVVPDFTQIDGKPVMDYSKGKSNVTFICQKCKGIKSEIYKDEQ